MKAAFASFVATFFDLVSSSVCDSFKPGWC